MFVRRLLRVDAGHGQSQQVVNRPHPVRVAPGQVIVHRHQVTAGAGQRIQVEGKGGHQRFALAGLHLGDFALMQDNASHQLDIEVALADGPFGGFTHGGKGFRQNLVRLFAAPETSLEFIRFGPQFGIAEFLKLCLKTVYPLDNRLEFFQLLFIRINQIAQPLKHPISP